MTYIFDIDGTICSNTNGHKDYVDALPIKERIDTINHLYERGNIIIMQTARGMGRNNNNQKKAYEDFYDFTKKQLDDWGLKYHDLFLGKPSGDMYIDDKAINDYDFFGEKNESNLH